MRKSVRIIILQLLTAICLMMAAGWQAEAAEGKGTQSFDNSLPVLYINSETSYSDVGWEYADVSAELKGEGYSAEQLYQGQAQLRLRGNSTSGLSKRPFKLKLEEKADLLGMGSSRHWVLIANAIDLTNLRNYSLQEFAGALGLDCMESCLVNLVYNGEYMGLYQLSEQVRIGKTRVDIYDWEDLAEDLAKKLAEDFVDRGLLAEADRDRIVNEIEEDLEADYCWVTDEDKSFYVDYLYREAGMTRIEAMVDLDGYLEEVPEVNGGCLLEMDFYAGSRADLYTAYRLPIYISSPDYEESDFAALEDYMYYYVQAMEYAMHSTDFVFHSGGENYYNTDTGYYDYRSGRRKGTAYELSDFTAPMYDGWHYTDFVDLDSVINNMIVCELSDNWDCMKNSFFMYKDLDSKLVFGPVWDFDWAFGNSMYGIDTAGRQGTKFAYAQTWQTTSEYFANEQYYQTQQFNRLLIRDPYFVVRLYERYREVQDTLIDGFYSEYEDLSSLYADACEDNYERWRGTDSSGGLAGSTYRSQLNYTLDFISQRVEWLDAQFADIDTLMDSLGYYKASDSLTLSDVSQNADEDGISLTVNVSGSLRDKTSAISFQVNGTYFCEAEVTDGTAVVNIPCTAFEEEADHLGVVVFRALDSKGKYIQNVVGTEKGVYTNAYSNYTIIEPEFFLSGLEQAGEAGKGAIGAAQTGSSEEGRNGTEGQDVAEDADSAESGVNWESSAMIYIIPGSIAVLILAIGMLVISLTGKRKKRS